MGIGHPVPEELINTGAKALDEILARANSYGGRGGGVFWILAAVASRLLAVRWKLHRTAIVDAPNPAVR